MHVIAFVVLLDNILNLKQKKKIFDFGPCSENQGEQEAEEEGVMDVDSFVDVPDATGVFFFRLPKSLCLYSSCQGG